MVFEDAKKILYNSVMRKMSEKAYRERFQFLSKLSNFGFQLCAKNDLLYNYILNFEIFCKKFQN